MRLLRRLQPHARLLRRNPERIGPFEQEAGIEQQGGPPDRERTDYSGYGDDQRYRADIGDDEIVVRYRKLWDDMLTKEYTVPPGLPLGEAPTAWENGKQIVNRLAIGKENIPEPWKAIYIRLSRRLIVQMREEATVDAMDAAIDRAWFDYFEAAKKK